MTVTSMTSPMETADTIADSMEEDAGNLTPATDKLAAIVSAAEDLRKLQQRIAKGEALLEELNKERHTLQTQTLPTLMEEAGITSLTLEGDDQLVKGEELYASVSKENMPKFVQWLDKYHYGDIVKAQIVVPVNRDDPKATSKLTDFFKKAKVLFSESYSIHPQTLKAFVRERLDDEGKSKRKLPTSLKYHVEPTVKIKPPKASKKTSRSN